MSTLWVLLLFAAQTGSGGITGTISDQTGAGIPAVQLRVVSEDNGAEIKALTGDDGHFRATSLIPGSTGSKRPRKASRA
jgi:hypothetical protein